jgi:hypothetical protein
MESMPNKPQSENKDQDVDLGVLIYKAAQAVKRFFALVGRGFAALGTALLFSLFFLRRNILWLLLGTVAGLAYGIYLKSRDGSSYSSSMTVRTNFNSSPSLYNTIDYINALIGQGRLEDLSRLFSISSEDAKTVRHVEARPIRNELMVAEMYREQFLTAYRHDHVRFDTLWPKTIKYEDFKSSLERDDYPYHLVTVTSTRSDIFPKIQKGITDFISKNEVLSRNRQVAREINVEEEALLRSSISGLDTLRSTYNKSLLAGGQIESQRTVNVFEDPVRIEAPELELYDKMLVLKDELKSTRNNSLASQEIVQVYSPFNPVGKEVPLFRQNVFRNALTGFLLMLFLLIVISLYRFLVKLERLERQKRKSLEPSLGE